MRILPLLLATTLSIVATGSFAQQATWDSATYNLHKFEQKIGKEKYVVTKSGGSTVYKVDFRFVDRGSAVPLKASIVLDAATKEPTNFTIKGKTSRMSVIDDSISIINNQVSIRKDSTSSSIALKPNSFPIAGYSPGTAQMLLIQYWKRHQRPKRISMLPDGQVQVMLDGMDTISLNNHKTVLERYNIAGLIWGNELVWTDREGHLYCLITNDAEGDKLEMMLEPYESLLPDFINKAAVYSMRLFASANSTNVASSKILYIMNGTVVDVVNNKTIPNATIVIENGKIKNITTAKFKLKEGTPVIDATGKTILPGLWDMHAHFEQGEWGPAYLAAGITTVRDCGNEFGYINAIQKAIDEGKGVGPHILKAGIIDGKGPEALGIIQADNVAEAKAAVQRYKGNGFDQIKIYSSMKPAVVKAVCEEAHRLNLSVTGHIPEGMRLQQGIDSGMDQVNHITYITDVMKLDRKTFAIDLKAGKTDSVLQFLKDHHIVVDPTLGVFELSLRSLKDDITLIEPNFSSIPLPLQELFKNTGMAPKKAEALKGYIRSIKEVVKAMFDRGIPIVAGTDMGMPGYSLYRELELYVQGGLTPMQALTTATITPARVMGKELKTGSLDIGKDADIIIVDANPLDNISNIRKVSTVIKNGKVYDPKKLHKMVGFTE